MFKQEERIQLIGFRVKHDINQNDFSRGIISRNQLSNIESGKSSTTEKVLFQLYLRLCEYMIVLGDYKRPSFSSLQYFAPYKKLQQMLDFYEYMEAESLQRKELVEGSLNMNHSYFGLIGTVIYEKIAEQFIKKNDLENAQLFYLKAFYTLGSCHKDAITYGYMEKLIKKIADFAKASHRYFALIELYDQLLYIQEELKLDGAQKDFLYELAKAYKAIEADEKAVEVCKKLVTIGFNGGNVHQAVLGQTYFMLAQYQHEQGQVEVSQRSLAKALDLVRQYGSKEAFEHLREAVDQLNWEG